MKSIRFHLASRLLIGFVLLLSCASVLVYFISARILESDFDTRLFATADAVLASVSQEGDKVTIDWTNLPHSSTPDDLIYVLDSSGHSLSGDSVRIPMPTKSGYQDVLLPRGKFRVLTLTFKPHVEPDDVASTPPGLVHDCTLVVASDRRQLDRTLDRLALVLVAMTSLTLLLSIGVVILALRKGLQPLADLSRDVATIDATSLEKRIQLEALPTELEPIAEKLNDLLGRLQVSFAREKQFSADVSHELRTPIAELRTLAKVMLRLPGNSAETTQAFRDTLDAACQMESLVSVLLEIVRNEQNPRALQVSELDLAAFARDIWHNFEKKAAGKNLQVTLPAPDESPMIETDPRLLKIILSNLFSNAVEYTPERGRLEIGLETTAGAICLTVANTVTALDPADLPHLFERFWRKDKARSTSEHLGLGLPLAKTLSDRLKMGLTTSMSNGSTVIFQLRIPLAKSTARAERTKALAKEILTEP